MIRLFKNGVVESVGDATLVLEFEKRVARWNDELSGWATDGSFLRIDSLPDVTDDGDDPDQPVPEFLGEFPP